MSKKISTDLDELKALLGKFRIGYEENVRIDGTTEIECFEGMAKVNGHCGHFTSFRFYKDGRFVEMGAWG